MCPQKPRAAVTVPLACFREGPEQRVDLSTGETSPPRELAVLSPLCQSSLRFPKAAMASGATTL